MGDSGVLYSSLELPYTDPKSVASPGGAGEIAKVIDGVRLICVVIRLPGVGVRLPGVGVRLPGVGVTLVCVAIRLACVGARVEYVVVRLPGVGARLPGVGVRLPVVNCSGDRTSFAAGSLGCITAAYTTRC